MNLEGDEEAEVRGWHDQEQIRVPKKREEAHVERIPAEEGEAPEEVEVRDDGDGIREVHCNGCEGVGAPLRTFLRVFRGVHKKHLGEYVATFETMTNAKRITGEILRRMCFVQEPSQSEET